MLTWWLSAPEVRPCSYCARTKKECTLYWAWSQLRISKAFEATSCSNHQRGVTTSSKRRRLDLINNQQTAQLSHPDDSLATSEYVSNNLSGTWSYEGLETNSPEDQIELLITSSQGFSGTGNVVQQSTDAMQDRTFLDPEYSLDPLGALGALTDGASHSPFEESFGGQDQFPGRQDWDFLGTISQDVQPGSSDEDMRVTSERHHQSSMWPQQRTHSLSPFALEQNVIDRTNKGLISSNLLHIYHDVMENSLSCWLTEVTCPYNSNIDPLRKSKLAEWGPSWSNRIYHRTLKLEQAAKGVKLINLSQSQDRACDRALHLSIMAFATQWAQGSRRQRQRYHSYMARPEPQQPEHAFDELANEFDRDIQWHFWNKAEKCLEEVACVESFRVVCAEAVLGLSQKPWEQNQESAPSEDSAPVSCSRVGFDQNNIMLEISRAISQDGPPTYLERAARKMHALKYRFDSALNKSSLFRNREGTKNSVRLMDEEDQNSVGLLYWLTIMFDTVSSSMNERPLVVSDQDCQHDDCQEEEERVRWNLDLFAQDKLDSPSRMVRWPCTYEEAAEAVTKSGPVKILLYRHVSWLQNMLRRGQSGEKVEGIIRSAMTLCHYWSVTYGNLFRDLLDNFGSVPGRIQSWFVCIAAHWHLASLMLADLIDLVDKHDLGLKDDTQKRRRGRVIAKLQETSVKELSDLARVATPPSDDDNGGLSVEPQLPGLHPSVNEGTILTEPWTVILIRAFSRATVLLLSEAEEYRQFALAAICSNELSETIRRGELCVKALWFLGKKSDMARRVAHILTRELAAYQTLCNSVHSQFSNESF
ncbi:hypothetical protein JX265_011201 [Neoarthrinium moseri]|uniref:Regulatory protein alcR n=1 Tax=Neoarthrinium moseri TaxID=1658444 RepID=A0A9P9WCZ3_9PEZI|nr:hypothetical protein JX265_011201 [Neoarthrinium moseri]